MRPSSSPSEAGLFDAIVAHGAVRDEVSDAAWLRALLEVEAALAQAHADAGTIPSGHADAIVAVCDPAGYDVAAIGQAAAGAGNPVLPLVGALRAAVPEEMAASVHFGATTQDILDTAAMLVAHRALGVILADLGEASEQAGRLAEAHGQTSMAGRTLLQRAERVTFGFVAGVWRACLDEAAERLAGVRHERLALQFGGAVGTQPAVPGLAARLGLAEPAMSWHTNRGRVGELAAALGLACGAVGKVARDVTLLAQTEVGEVREASEGRSTAMPHKRNPVASICAVACAMQAPGLVATVLGAMVQEHQRAAGAWHAEWRPMRELLISTGSAAAWLRECLAGLHIDAEAMAANLGADHDADNGIGLFTTWGNR